MTFKLPRPKPILSKSHSSVFLSHIYYDDVLCRIFIFAIVNT